MGIFIEFADFKRWIERAGEYKDIPSPIANSLTILVKGMVCCGIFAALDPYLNLAYNWSDEYSQKPWLYKMFYYYASMTVKRVFYYGPMLMASSGTAACGIHYNGKNKDGVHLWDKIVAVKIWEIETATNPMQMLSAWNYQVHVWLKYYI